MIKIKKILSREILDSRGNPTIECDIFLEDGSFGRASVPSGASTGMHEAIELRDQDNNRYSGKGVLKSIDNIKNIISPNIYNKIFNNIGEFDKTLIDIDGTKNKSNIGANSILAVSLAFAKALSKYLKKDFYNFLSKDNEFILPVPMINIINGGVHADNNLDIQEFMITPIGAKSFKEAIRYGSEIFSSLKSILKKNNYNTNVGDEGGFAPNINSSKKVIELILEAITIAGFNTDNDIKLSLDVASTELYKNNKYHLKGEGKIINSNEMIEYLTKLINDYPIYSIEDGMAEDDWQGWIDITEKLGNRIQLVGDDLFVTNIERLNKGINLKASNSILIKPNQIGTLSETLAVIELAKKNNYTCVISHRSGETEDTTIADLAVGTSSGQIKTGSITRTDRTSKYNQLLRIEENLAKESKYAGNLILRY
tara:strand:+ start:1642 stop:2919 length:1278 start_codon:yes stop_codon:yes gene_type:complete